jgi:hypothetical protein
VAMVPGRTGPPGSSSRGHKGRGENSPPPLRTHFTPACGSDASRRQTKAMRQAARLSTRDSGGVAHIIGKCAIPGGEFIPGDPKNFRYIG